MTTFVQDLQRFQKNATAKTDKRVREITQKLFASVIMSSPVGDRLLWKRHIEHPGWALQPKGYVGGRFRGNWQTSQASPVLGATERIDPSGALAIAEAQEKGGGLGSLTYMTNNLPYAQALEYDGHSGQAPEGMVRINMARIAAIVGASKV